MIPISKVANELGVSTSTARRLVRQYDDYLSTPTEAARVRHYSAEDVTLLARIRTLQAEGLSAEQIHHALNGSRGTSHDDHEADAAGSDPARDAPGDALALAPQNAAVLASAMQQIADAQQVLLATQQAHREAIEAILDESEALKDENERLRRRLRMMEEQMSQMKESDWAQRVTLEERLNQLERPDTRPWWSRLWRRAP